VSGPQLYDAYCATCHQARGQGSFEGGLPSLLQNTALGRENINNLVMVMLEGLHRQPCPDAGFRQGAIRYLGRHPGVPIGAAPKPS
jgi:mono/diheme cytochrome c family protein